VFVVESEDLGVIDFNHAQRRIWIVHFTNAANDGWGLYEEAGAPFASNAASVKGMAASGPAADPVVCEGQTARLRTPLRDGAAADDFRIPAKAIQSLFRHSCTSQAFEETFAGG
jgi:hypothetical protein